MAFLTSSSISSVDIFSLRMSTDDMDEEVKKATVITPICHLILGQVNSAAEEDECENAAE